MGKVGCVIIEGLKRPDKVLVEKFGNAAVANLDDCMNCISTAYEDIRPIDKGKLLGSTFTVKVPSGDNSVLYAAMDLAKPGDVIVIDAGGDTHRSIFGELIVTYCRKCGIVGIMVDGPLCDIDAMSQLTDFPICAGDIAPDDSYKNGPGEISTPIVCSGRLTNPRFIVIGDEGGVIFINPSDTPEFLEKVSKLHENEIRIINTVEKDGIYVHLWINEKLEGLEVEHISYAGC